MTDAGKNSERSEYDVVVIGAGPVGENVADRARAAGLSTAVVESELVGGECSYWACMPSKALLRPVVARADARRVPGLSAAVQGPLDVEAVLAHRDEEASHWKDDGQVAWLESVGADVHRGTGRLHRPPYGHRHRPRRHGAPPHRPARRRRLHRLPGRGPLPPRRRGGPPLDQPRSHQRQGGPRPAS